MDRRPWWRIPPLAHAAVALVGAALVLRYSLDFWQPCYANGHDSIVCLQLQSHDSPDPSQAWLYIPWLVALGAAAGYAILAAVARAWDVTRWASGAIVVLLCIGNPVADYMLTPFFNGGYVSHDSPPGLGIPVAFSLLASGALAIISVVRGRAARRRQPVPAS